MHQSIPAWLSPPPPRCGQLRGISSPCQSRGGALANLAQPGDQASASPGGIPEKFVDVFKGIFPLFSYVL